MTPARALVALWALCAAPWAFPQTRPAMGKNVNPLLCDPDTGLCAVPGGAAPAEGPAITPPVEAGRITVLYFTDPICSGCWGAEPQWRRLKLAYGGILDVQYHMGGLLPSWEVYDSGGISKPADVAGHWDEVSPHYRMPIIGDVWLEDPLPSSWPPSIAFKAAQLQDHAKALTFLRRLREQVLVEGRNITKWPVIAEAGAYAGLDTARLRSDGEGPAKALFDADLTLARSLGVRGFPTFILRTAEGGRQVVYGARPYAQFEAAVRALRPDAQAAPLPTALDGLFRAYPSWCAEEVAVVLGIGHGEALARLRAAQAKGELISVDTRNGSVWRRR